MGRFEGRRALVVGFGVSGRAAADVLLAEGASVRVSEARPVLSSDAIPPADAVAGRIELLSGGHRPQHLDDVDLVVLSPGVPERSDVVSWALDRDLPVWSELELGARLCGVPVIGVTGTNGKTTTVELIAEMARASGARACACGNVGYPFCVAARQPFDLLVVEASSFQLRFQETFHPTVSMLLNVAPDHLDWHVSFEAYVAAKARIYANQDAGDVHVGNADDPAAAAVSRLAPCRVEWFGSSAAAPSGGRIAAWPSGNSVTVNADGIPSTFPLPAGTPRTVAADAAAAALAGLSFGLPSDAVQAGLERFVPLPHRGSAVAAVGGVVFVDDSKATNPHAALASLRGRRDVVLIAGGLAKGVDLSPLADGASTLRAVVAIGEAAPEIARVLSGAVPVSVAASMEEAVRLGFEAAVDGGTVLLAPACASQDMFRDYRERGERFAAAAASLADGRREQSVRREGVRRG
jgi:UDP-N-acetylmuramoylalanine--D-glutamate ligase